MPTNPNMLAAEAVADLLNAHTWDTGHEFTAVAKRIHKVSPEDVTGLMVLVEPVYEFGMSYLNRGELLIETPVRISIADKCKASETEKAELLQDLMVEVATFLATTPISDEFGYPSGDSGIEAEGAVGVLNEIGLFMAEIVLPYEYAQDITG